MRYCLTALALMLAGLISAAETKSASTKELPWKRHAVDPATTTMKGADGVRPMDVNGDGLTDFVTGWEQGNAIRAYLNPGPAKAKAPWPAVTVGMVKGAEDAVFVDLDGDGAVDVVSCTEGKTRTVFVHWAPKDEKKYLDSASWKTEAFPATEKQQAWMFALPMQIDGKHGIDLIVSSKGKNASISWLQAPENPRDLAAWKMHRLYDAGWMMSLIPLDVDGDGDQDVVASDRKGKNTGAMWLENPGQKAALAGSPWKVHRIGADGEEVMFLHVADLNKDGKQDVLTTTWNGHIVASFREPGTAVSWRNINIQNPVGVKWGKALAVGDIDLDGRQDLVHTANTHGDRSKLGVVWMSYREAVTDSEWDVHDISGREGVKYDLVQAIDLDGDGDLDVLTCEEVDNLGVIWYENPAKP